MTSKSLNIEYSRPSTPSPYLQAFLGFIDAWSALDHQRILSFCDNSFTHHTLPKSLGRPPSNKEEYDEFVNGVISICKKLKVILHDVYEDGERISAHASSLGESATGATYTNEYSFFVHFVPLSKSEPGELPKAYLLKQFIDSDYHLKFFAAERLRVEAAGNMTA